MNKSPRTELAALIDRYEPPIAAQAPGALAWLRKRLPDAVELVYDNYNALAIGFSPTERASDAVLSIALYPRWVTLFFLRGVELGDPEELLRGEGSRVRHIRLESRRTLAAPAVADLVDQAIRRAPKFAGPRRLVIKSVSRKQRPRRRM